MPTGEPSNLAFGRVRGAFWALLAGALIVALALPIVALWHEASSAVLARACLWPASPHLGQQVRVVVVVPDATDRAAAQGPWAHTVVAWDMETMAMNTHPLAVAGSPRNPGTFTIPLDVPMAGPWWARVSLHAPGRPQWQTVLHFTVLPLAGVAGTGTGQASTAATSPFCSSGRGSGT
jgi:hypothetical protein